jgi:hypothetical protein
LLQAQLYMEIEEQKVKRLSDNCFNFIVFFFRLGGVPFKINKISIIYAIYMTTVIFCSSSTIIGLFVDVYKYWDDLGHIMTSLRVLMPLMDFMFIYCYCR